MVDEASQFKKELDLLKLELSTMKNSIELLQSDPVVNNLPGGSLVTPNLSTREHSPYWGPFRCEISEDGYSVNVGEGVVFFGSQGHTHDFPTDSNPGDDSVLLSAYANEYIWIGVKCTIDADPLSNATYVKILAARNPVNLAGQYDVWLAKVYVNSEGKATWLQQRWQGLDIYAPVWLYCADNTDGDGLECDDYVKETKPHSCWRVAQLGSPVCNPGNHNHSFYETVYAEIEALKVTAVGSRITTTDCWCGQEAPIQDLSVPIIGPH